MTAKIEPWMVEAVKEMMVKHLGFGASVGTNWMLLEIDLVASIAAHAPKQEPPEGLSAAIAGHFEPSVPVRAWVNIKDHLPIDGKYLVCYLPQPHGRGKQKRQKIYLAWWASGKWRDIDRKKTALSERVTHWMPLPEPPEGLSAAIAGHFEPSVPVRELNWIRNYLEKLDEEFALETVKEFDELIRQAERPTGEKE